MMAGLDTNGNPILASSFTGPVLSGQRYNFDARVLDRAENQFDYYIEPLNDLPFNAEVGDVIPWFGLRGGGKQAKFYIPNVPGTNTPYT